MYVKTFSHLLTNTCPSIPMLPKEVFCSLLVVDILFFSIENIFSSYESSHFVLSNSSFFNVVCWQSRKHKKSVLSKRRFRINIVSPPKTSFLLIIFAISTSFFYSNSCCQSNLFPIIENIFSHVVIPHKIRVPAVVAVDSRQSNLVQWKKMFAVPYYLSSSFDAVSFGSLSD